MMRKRTYLLGIITVWVLLFLLVYQNSLRPDRSTAFITSVENGTVEDVTGKGGKRREWIETAVEKNMNVIVDFFMDMSKERKSINIGGFDFTGDGQLEIVLSKGYVSRDSAMITYNHIYDQNGNELFSFLGGPLTPMEIYSEDNNIFYIQNYIHWGANNNGILYSRITKQDEWKAETMYIEWITGQGWNEEDKEHYFYTVSEEEESTLWTDSYLGLISIRDSGKADADMEQFEQYIKLYENMEAKNIDTSLGYICLNENEIMMICRGERKVIRELG